MDHALKVVGTTLEIVLPEGIDLSMVKVTSGEERTYFFESDISRIKDIVRAKGMTQKELAQITGITEHTLSCYLRRVNRPPVDYALKIADALGVDVRDLWPVR